MQGDSSSSAQSPENGPLDGEQQPTARENTPEQPGGDPRDRQGEKPESEQQQGTPKNPLASKDEGLNRPGNRPPDSETARAGSSPDAERWGHLPPRVRDVLRTESTGDMPVRYREWIDQYYRRLNQGR